MSLPSKWADSSSEAPAEITALTPKRKENQDEMPSKWASPVTSEKGKPLVSKWATADSEEDDSMKTSSFPDSPAERRGKKKGHHHREGASRRSNRHDEIQHQEGRALEARLDSLKITGQSKSRKNDDHNHLHHQRYEHHQNGEDQWESENEEEEEVHGEKVEASPAAVEFAKRLGLSIGNDTPTKASRAHAPKPSHHSPRKGNKERRDRTHNRRDKPTNHTTSFGADEEEETEPELTEEEKRRIEARDKLVQQIVDGGQLNWADLDDDDDF